MNRPQLTPAHLRNKYIKNVRLQALIHMPLSTTALTSPCVMFNVQSDAGECILQDFGFPQRGPFHKFSHIHIFISITLLSEGQGGRHFKRSGKYFHLLKRRTVKKQALRNRNQRELKTTSCWSEDHRSTRTSDTRGRARIWHTKYRRRSAKDTVNAANSSLRLIMKNAKKSDQRIEVWLH